LNYAQPAKSSCRADEAADQRGNGRQFRRLKSVRYGRSGGFIAEFVERHRFYYKRHGRSRAWRGRMKLRQASTHRAITSTCQEQSRQRPSLHMI
jgi:hypothetical protein